MKIVTAAIFRKKGKYLLCQRNKNDAHSLKWEFPGGKLEGHESAEECLIREIKEELNIDIEVERHFCDSVYKYENGEILLKAYEAKIVGGTMKLLVHSEAVWVRAEELLQYELLPADVEIAERIIACDGGNFL